MGDIVKLHPAERPDERVVLEMLMVPYRLLNTTTEEVLVACRTLEQSGASELARKRLQGMLAVYLEKRSRLFFEMFPILERLLEIYRRSLPVARHSVAVKSLEVIAIALLEAEVVGERILSEEGATAEWLATHVMELGVVIDRVRLFYDWFAEILVSTDEERLRQVADACLATWELMDRTYRT